MRSEKPEAWEEKSARHYRYAWRGKPVRCGDCGTVYDSGSDRRCPRCGCKWSKTGYYKVVVPPNP